MVLIDLRSLEPGYHSLSLEPSAADLGLEPEAFRDILVEISLDYDGKQIVMDMIASSVAVLTCDRTLVEFDQSIRGEYTVLFSASVSEEESADEVRSISATDEQIDITDIVRDTLLLAIPIRKIAPGAEEAEIPIAFGAPDEVDVDPRWEALKTLSDVEGDEKSSSK